MKLNLYRGAVISGAILLVGSGIVSCSSSTNEEKISTPSLLEGTILEDSYVITDSNGNTLIVRPTEEYRGKDVSKAMDNMANHYIDVLSNNCYHENQEDRDYCYNDEFGIFAIDIVSREPISVYLTAEDLTKKELSDEDVVDIITRIKESNLVEASNIEEKGIEYTK